jgi:curved DNA-binding protein CbpA
MIKRSPYEILGLEGEFEYKDIKRAYRKAIRDNPPEQKPEEFAMICDAYESLSSEEYIFNEDGKANLFKIDLDLKIDDIEMDNSKYLKKIFEVPFLI